jgi:hypothetical protein
VSGYEPLFYLALCVLGSAVGWKKIAPGLVLFVVWDLLWNHGSNSEDILKLLFVIGIWQGLRWICSKVKAARVKRKAEAERKNDMFTEDIG